LRVAYATSKGKIEKSHIGGAGKWGYDPSQNNKFQDWKKSLKIRGFNIGKNISRYDPNKSLEEQIKIRNSELNDIYTNGISNAISQVEKHIRKLRKNDPYNPKIEEWENFKWDSILSAKQRIAEAIRKQEGLIDKNTKRKTPTIPLGFDNLGLPVYSDVSINTDGGLKLTITENTIPRKRTYEDNQREFITDSLNHQNRNYILPLLELEDIIIERPKN